jgi:hypothetical protein
MHAAATTTTTTTTTTRSRRQVSRHAGEEEVEDVTPEVRKRIRHRVPSLDLPLVMTSCPIYAPQSNLTPSLLLIVGEGRAEGEGRKWCDHLALHALLNLRERREGSPLMELDMRAWS